MMLISWHTHRTSYSIDDTHRRFASFYNYVTLLLQIMVGVGIGVIAGRRRLLLLELLQLVLGIAGGRLLYVLHLVASGRMVLHLLRVVAGGRLLHWISGDHMNLLLTHWLSLTVGLQRKLVLHPHLRDCAGLQPIIDRK